MKFRIIFACLFAGLSLALPTHAVAGGGPIELVRGGKSAFGILPAPDAPSSVKAAASELQRCIRKATGAKAPILAQSGAPQGSFISLGDNAAARAAGLSARALPLEGFRIVVRQGNIYILGPDTEDWRSRGRRMR